MDRPANNTFGESVFRLLRRRLVTMRNVVFKSCRVLLHCFGLLSGLSSGNAYAEPEEAFFKTALPVIVSGSFDGGTTNYRTSIRVFNRSNDVVNCSVVIYSADGAVSTMQLEDASSRVFSSDLPSSLFPDDSVNLVMATSGQSAEVTWGLISADGPLQVESVSELLDETGNGIDGAAAHG